MGNGNIIAGIDMGGGRVSCILAEKNEGQPPKILAGALASCKGLKGGVVVDIMQTSSAVSQVIEEVEKEADAEVDEVYLAVRGAHIESKNSHGAYNIARSDREINAEDVHCAIENAKAIPLSSNKEIVHVIPQSFSIDRQKGVPNPEGMEGSLLEVDVHIVLASSAHLNNLSKSVAKAGFEVKELLYSPVILGECVLSSEEKELGAVLIDFGGETVSIGIYVDGSIKFSKDLPYGSDLITRDIAYMLHTSRDTARDIKERHGMAVPSLLADDEEIQVSGLDKRAMHEVKASYVIDIIQPRIEEILEKVKDEIARTPYADVPSVGVIAGGGSMMRGMTDICSQVLGLREVRQATVMRDLAICSEKFFHPSYSTALSAVIYSTMGDEEEGDLYAVKKVPFTKKVNRFFKDMFGKD
ncbi:MAG: cell division protein FtsA [Elusimicrobia bacterium]|nr:cell division protein FtsA [Elusimicrobiota bacterium]